MYYKGRGPDIAVAVDRAGLEPNKSGAAERQDAGQPAAALTGAFIKRRTPRLDEAGWSAPSSEAGRAAAAGRAAQDGRASAWRGQAAMAVARQGFFRRPSRTEALLFIVGYVVCLAGLLLGLDLLPVAF